MLFLVLKKKKNCLNLRGRQYAGQKGAALFCKEVILAKG